MSEFDGIDDDEAIPGAVEGGVEAVVLAAEEGRAMSSACLSCGATTIDAFCANCGQKNDDLRRSIFLLARDFVEDTFSFDSRMWRTLGMLAVTPGNVPKDYAHGRRSQFTPPVRLFLVVSFLFFLTLSLTQTLFVAIDVREPADGQSSGVTFLTDDQENKKVVVDGAEKNCNLIASLEFFVRASTLNNTQERWVACMEDAREAALASVTDAENNQDAKTADALTMEEAAKLASLLERLISGVSAAVEDPKAFNAAFNNWLPRVMFLMTPITALLMGVFIRGRDALFFDHMVQSLYGHSVAFALVGLAVIATQLGIPFAGLVTALGLFIYFVLAMKRAYGRGWVKTIYSSVMVNIFYMLILFTIVILITAKIILQG